MDTKDVTGDEHYRVFFDQIKKNVEQASRRKGEKPRDHPHPQVLVPPHYPPCVRPLQELKPLMISNMTLETHHRGSRTLLHVLTPPDRMTAVMAIAEDEEGTAVLLQLYNLPEESKVSKNDIVKPGYVCIVKEPFFKTSTSDGSYGLRVDHVSDIIWLEDTDDRIPLKWRKRVVNLDESSKEIRMQGNAAVQKKNWGEAERLYTSAIRTAKTPEEWQLAHLNRSFCNLHLDRPQKALDDARKGNTNENPPNEKALFREAKALYALGIFGMCLEKLLELVRANPENSDAWTEVKRVKRRLGEQETGSYQFSSMYKQAEATPPLIDCATHVGPIEVRDSPGRGKGLFTTKPVKTGDLLLSEKAFGYSYANDDSPTGRSNTTMLVDLNTKRIRIGGQASLVVQIVQKIFHNDDVAETFTDLHHGDYTPVAVSKVDGVPVVDTFLVTNIIEKNSFGAARTSYKTTKDAIDDTSGERHDRSAAHTTCGIWPIASRINHSCVPNCHRSFIGDMQLVRASQDIEAGAELRFPYWGPPPHATYKQTQEKLSNWGFVCDCALCLDKKSTSRKTHQERKALCASLKPIMKPNASVAQLTQAKKILENLEKTYAVHQDALVPRLEMWDPCFAVGAALIMKNKLTDGLEMLLKGFEALGYIIVAHPPRDSADGKKKKVMLEIQRWGDVSEYAVGAFVHMRYAYSKLAPELCEVVKNYASIVYSIHCGESETLGTAFPDFK
ncbi:hypothetical protein M426DRAFT_65939 [Hypoxylon sp. CI-4A]|nr:hypothetical protein M426DRAFT_65939 [Hypoxylon sp. CI-4A]